MLSKGSVKTSGDEGTKRKLRVIAMLIVTKGEISLTHLSLKKEKHFFFVVATTRCFLLWFIYFIHCACLFRFMMFYVITQISNRKFESHTFLLFFKEKNANRQRKNNKKAPKKKIFATDVSS